MEMFVKALKITNEAQTNVEVGLRNYLKERQDTFFSSQDDLLPPRVNQSNMGIMRHTKKKGNPSTMKEKKVLSKQK
jgi:hypothetical protein